MVTLLWSNRLNQAARFPTSNQTKETMRDLPDKTSTKWNHMENAASEPIPPRSQIILASRVAVSTTPFSLLSPVSPITKSENSFQTWQKINEKNLSPLPTAVDDAISPLVRPSSGYKSPSGGPLGLRVSSILGMLIDGEKWACEACVRGHRVTTCKHHGISSWFYLFFLCLHLVFFTTLRDQTKLTCC